MSCDNKKKRKEKEKEKNISSHQISIRNEQFTIAQFSMGMTKWKICQWIDVHTKYKLKQRRIKTKCASEIEEKSYFVATKENDDEWWVQTNDVSKSIKKRDR